MCTTHTNAPTGGNTSVNSIGVGTNSKIGLPSNQIVKEIATTVKNISYGPTTQERMHKLQIISNALEGMSLNQQYEYLIAKVTASVLTEASGFYQNGLMDKGNQLMGSLTGIINSIKVEMMG